jgi:hypothetical protein
MNCRETVWRRGWDCRVAHPAANPDNCAGLIVAALHDDLLAYRGRIVRELGCAHSAANATLRRITRAVFYS